MPTRKTSAAPKAAPKTVKAAPKQAPAAHNHEALEAELAALRKEVEALKGQCHSCCADLAELKAGPQSEARDPRVDALIKAMMNCPQSYNQWRAFIKSSPDLR